MSANSVQHNAAASRFETTVDGHESVAEYRLEDGRMIFTHTYVPPALRGRGVAADLMTASLGYAREQGLRVVPLCSYVDAYIQRHPEYEDLRDA